MDLTTADFAGQDQSMLSYAIKVTTFTTCKVYDFADGSYLVLHDSGRIEVNEVHF